MFITFVLAWNILEDLQQKSTKTTRLMITSCYLYQLALCLVVVNTALQKVVSL